MSGELRDGLSGLGILEYDHPQFWSGCRGGE